MASTTNPFFWLLCLLALDNSGLSRGAVAAGPSTRLAAWETCSKKRQGFVPSTLSLLLLSGNAGEGCQLSSTVNTVVTYAETACVQTVTLKVLHTLCEGTTNPGAATAALVLPTSLSQVSRQLGTVI